MFSLKFFANNFYYFVLRFFTFFFLFIIFLFHGDYDVKGKEKIDDDKANINFKVSIVVVV